MRIKPDDNWRWFYDDEQDSMMLGLADGTVFRSRYSRKMLSPDAFVAHRFCVEDAALWFSFEDQCREYELDAEQRAELVLNALVAHRFLKPLMPRSWYFVSHSGARSPALAERVSVVLCENGASADLLVVETGENAALCLLAQPVLHFADRTMVLGDAIKVMHDRLLPGRESRMIRFDRAV